LGPTFSGKATETYNVFQEGLDDPGTGRAPLQSFHAITLSHQVSSLWVIGATLSEANGYTGKVVNKGEKGTTITNIPDSQFFNARVYVGLPPLKMKVGTFFTTLSLEAPTSSVSRNDNMRIGWVASSSLSFNLPSNYWSGGLTAQVYRIYYKTNTPTPQCNPGFVCNHIPLQTMIISGGPYLNYRFSDRWMMNSIMTFDWDQRGSQSGTNQFNNNLPHRGRIGLTYFPQKIKYFQSIGLFSQTLLKFRSKTTALGADFSLVF
jgi:hypothetical protein